MITIRRGTTPTITVNVGMDLTDYTCILSFGAPKFEKLSIDNSQMVSTVEDGKTNLAFTLTQAQTLSLIKGKTNMQLRVIKDSVALASEIEEINVCDVIKDGEIEDVY